jgi:hypothetical protein
MGTMLQRYNFSEEDFRGERFKDFPHSPKKQRFIINNSLMQSKKYTLLILKLELISLKPIPSQEPRSEWPITT